MSKQKLWAGLECTAYKNCNKMYIHSGVDCGSSLDTDLVLGLSLEKNKTLM